VPNNKLQSPLAMLLIDASSVYGRESIERSRLSDIMRPSAAPGRLITKIAICSARCPPG
jgi:hypothetical protein